MKPHGGNIYDFASPESLIDFSSNINPYGPPDDAVNAAKEAIASIRKYPDTGQTEIRKAFSDWLGAPSEGLVFGNGASELIAAVCSALRPKRILIVAPTFAEYAECAERLGIPVVVFPMHSENAFAFPVDEIKRSFAPGDLVIACQPNNPTGRAWEKGELTELAETARERGGWMMVDECFINLTCPQAFSCIGMLDFGNIVVLRAVTKDFSAPGLRVGFIAATPQFSAAVRSQIQPWPLNCVGEAFAVACARSPQPFLRDSAHRISIERERLATGLERLGFNPFPSVVNYILVQSKQSSVETLYRELLEKSLLIRRCGNFRQLGDAYFRVAVRCEADNEKLLSTLAMLS